MVRPKSARGRVFRRVLKGLCIPIGAGMASLLILLAVMWREHRSPLELPTPTGTFGVGRTTFAWTNSSQIDEVTRSKRQVLVWMWCPAAHSTAGTQAEYLPQAWRVAVRKQQGTLMSTFLKRDPAVVRAHSLSNVPVAAEETSYPVVLMRAGGSALTTDFTTLAEDLASHGYFVVGFDAPYRSFVTVLPDGTAIPRRPDYNVENVNGNIGDPLIGKLLAMWTADAKFVVDRLNQLDADRASAFAGRMDLSRLGFMGHSFGGATALEFCHEDSRCRGAIDLDGIPFGSVVNDGLTKPCMFVLSDHSREMNDPSNRQVLSEMESIYKRDANGGYFAVIRNANHFSFSDQILLNSQIVVSTLAHVARFGGLDGRRGLAISADCVHSFFDAYLKGGSDTELRKLSTRHPEVQMQSR